MGRSDNTQAGPPLFFFIEPVDFFGFVFPGPAVDDGDEKKKEKNESHAGATPWGAHVYQIAGPNC